ncbi:DUF4383 domain-containing protein [Plantactinospora sp. WMMB334]|uniref:DUF4383 domain-containing protein n=1 Tax=Plantactinospora sp. WMMB334 TaxID=3404119 RepID=UPI003B961D9B
MAHIPVNHPARPVYRILAGLIGLYIVAFGVFGLVETADEVLFSRGSHWVLGLRTNMAFALVSVVFGLIVIFGAVHRGNIGHLMNLTAGVVFLVVALVMLTVLQTEANILNFSISTVVVSMLFGLVLLATGLYDKIGPHEDAGMEHEVRDRSGAGSGG